MKTKLATLLLIPGLALAGEVKLAWDWEPLPDSIETSPSFVLTGTRPFATITNQVSVFVGTNRTATITDLIPGIWSFSAQAVATNGVRSDPSNSVAVEIPVAPINMRTVVLQFGTTLTNFVDVGFFKVRLP